MNVLATIPTEADALRKNRNNFTTSNRITLVKQQPKRQHCIALNHTPATEKRKKKNNKHCGKTGHTNYKVRESGIK